jgi:hypothetical protein
MNDDKRINKTKLEETGSEYINWIHLAQAVV